MTIATAPVERSLIRDRTLNLTSRSAQVEGGLVVPARTVARAVAAELGISARAQLRPRAPSSC